MQMMKYTFFDTPILRVLLRWFSILWLKLIGWKREGELPDTKKFVMIAAPHTTNWDMPITIMVAFAFRLKIYWLGKKSLFKFPFKTIMRWMGGIPVDRSKNNNMVDAAIQLFNESKQMVLAVPPEGTRQKVRYWKTGFYHMALGAKVPIVTGFLDYKRKAGGVGPTIYPTGDLEKDMDLLKKFYSGVTGKYPDNVDNAELNSEKNSEKK